MATRLILSVVARTDGAGNARFVFQAVPASNVQTGTIGITNAPAAALFAATVGSSSGGFPWGGWSGNATFGPVQAWGGETLVVEASGLVPNQQYSCSWIGLIEDEQEATPVSPTALATSVAATSAVTSFTGARVERATAQSIPDGATTPVNWTTAPIDSDGFWAGGAPSRLTVPVGKGGIYRIEGNLQYAINGVGVRRASIPANAVTRAIGGPVPGDPSVVTGVMVGLLLALSAGDYVEVEAYQTSGGPLNLNGGASGSWLSIALEGT